MHLNMMVHSGQRLELLEEKYEREHAHTLYIFALQSAPTAQPTLLKAHSAAAPTPHRCRAPAQAHAAMGTQAP
jgi:hypothetical protein